jgi:hypothetical protein
MRKHYAFISLLLLHGGGVLEFIASLMRKFRVLGNTILQRLPAFNPQISTSNANFLLEQHSILTILEAKSSWPTKEPTCI